MEEEEEGLLAATALSMSRRLGNSGFCGGNEGEDGFSATAVDGIAASKSVSKDIRSLMFADCAVGEFGPVLGPLLVFMEALRDSASLDLLRRPGADLMVVRLAGLGERKSGSFGGILMVVLGFGWWRCGEGECKRPITE